MTSVCTNPPSGRNTRFMDLNTKVGGYSLGPDFAQHLERFYSRASAADKARCLELLTALQIAKVAQGHLKVTESAQTQPLRSKTPTPPARPRSVTSQDYVKRQHCRTPEPPRVTFCRTPSTRRPHTAMASYGDYSADYLNSPYVTSYSRDYEQKQLMATMAQRPASTRAFRASYPINGPVGSTTYRNEFYNKPQDRTQPIRTGSSSGVRRNNPHPPETFMVWKLPHSAEKEVNDTDWSTKVNDEQLDKAMRGQLSSTYRQDYKGRQQGVLYPELEQREDSPQIPYTINTTTRKTFQRQEQHGDLQGNTKRYGCNKNKHLAAEGTVPTCSTRYMNHLKSTTTYEREFIDRRNPPEDVRQVARQFGAQALKGRLSNASNSEHDETKIILETMEKGVKGLNSTPYDGPPPMAPSPPCRSATSILARESRSNCGSRVRPHIPSATNLYRSDAAIFDPNTIYDAAI